MVDTSPSFFEDCESDEILCFNEASSMTLPPTLSDSSSDCYFNTSLEFDSPTWNRNLVNMFDAFNEGAHSLTEGRNIIENHMFPVSNPQEGVEIGDRSPHTELDETNELFSHETLLSLQEQTTCSDNGLYLANEYPAAGFGDDRELTLPNQTSIEKDVQNPGAYGINDESQIFVTRDNDNDWPNTVPESTSMWNVGSQYNRDESVKCGKECVYEPTSDFVPTQKVVGAIPERHRQIQGKIIQLIQQIERCVNQDIPLTVRRKPRWENCSLEKGILLSKNPSQGEKTVKSVNCRRLQLMVRLLATIYQLLAIGTSCTKRELYYLHLELAQTPSYTYAALDDLCALLDADSWEMGIFNTPKGLIAGPVKLILNGGETIDCHTRWGTAVPLDVQNVTEVQLTAKLVLVVEKDTVFKRLLEDGILDKFPNIFVLITGKGYPDVSTRLLLKKISDSSNVSIMALVDADPHGIEIFCVYKFGSLVIPTLRGIFRERIHSFPPYHHSQAMAHHQQPLAVPTMEWIGLFPSDIELLGLQGVPLRENELKRIDQMMKRPYTTGQVQQELVLLRQLATKVEIEGLYNIASDFITSVYLKGKLKPYVLNL